MHGCGGCAWLVGAHVWLPGVCMVAGGWACMVLGGMHGCWGACMVAGVCVVVGGHAWLVGTCVVAGGHA